ncbi:hypothetical protein D9M68_123900 [compost metagenome]
MQMIKSLYAGLLRCAFSSRQFSPDLFRFAVATHMDGTRELTVFEGTRSASVCLSVEETAMLVSLLADSSVRAGHPFGDKACRA